MSHILICYVFFFRSFLKLLLFLVLLTLFLESSLYNTKSMQNPRMGIRSFNLGALLTDKHPCFTALRVSGDRFLRSGLMTQRSRKFQDFRY